jgi:hypothetical protein
MKGLHNSEEEEISIIELKSSKNDQWDQKET